MIGGSIAGCCAALELLDAGHRVTVFERSDAELHGLLGAGLGTPTRMFETLLGRGLVDPELPHLALREMLFVSRDPRGARHGRVALRRELVFVAFHWGDLHRGLRSRMPEPVYRAGQTVTEIAQADPDHAVVTLDDGSQHRFDLVICADGYLSPSRRALFPEVELRYRGYVCWRGVVADRQIADGTTLGPTFVRFGIGGLPGSFLYPVPGADGSIEVGERLINWGCYVPVPASDLADFLVSRDGTRYEGTIPPGAMAPEQERRLKSIARQSMPPFYANVISESEGTFVQAIYSLTAPAYRRGRICLTGDAGTVAPPFTGSGIFKAASNAINLRQALDAFEDVEAALAAWDVRETGAARELLELGDQYDDAFINRVPDLAAMDPAEAAQWWASSVRHPEWFNFEVG